MFEPGDAACVKIVNFLISILQKLSPDELQIITLPKKVINKIAVAINALHSMS